MRISVELVPRHRDEFVKELKALKKHFPSVDTINIPDIARYEITSLEAADFAKFLFPKVIPHLRAAAVDKDSFPRLLASLAKIKVEEALIVLGDDRKSAGMESLPFTTLELIRKFKREAKIKVYAAIDQYRTTFKEEYDYIQKKIDAGADGFFTQPFFDLRLIELYAKKLKSVKVFWGVSPVTSLKSKSYWESKNKIVFPPNFLPTLAWSREFAKEVFSFIKAEDANIYFMPIKTDARDYLSGII